MTAAAPCAAPLAALAVGQTFETGDTPARAAHVDGPILCLDRQTAVVCEDHGEVTLRHGELFIYDGSRYVAPRGAAAAAPPRGFVVNTPGREIVLRDAAAAVRVAGAGTRARAFKGEVWVDDFRVPAGCQATYSGSGADERPAVCAVARAARRAALACPAAQAGVPLAAENADMPGPPPQPRDWFVLVECSGDRSPAAARCADRPAGDATPHRGRRRHADGAGDRYGRRAARGRRRGAAGRRCAGHRAPGTGPSARRTRPGTGFGHRATGNEVACGIRCWCTSARACRSWAAGGAERLAARIPPAVPYVGVCVAPGEPGGLMRAMAGRSGSIVVGIDPHRAIGPQAARLVAALDGQAVGAEARAPARAPRKRVGLLSMLFLAGRMVPPRPATARRWSSAPSCAARRPRAGRAAGAARTRDPRGRSPAAIRGRCAPACLAAARILDRLDARELAWQYATTPLAGMPAEAAAWLELAHALQRDGCFGLADRAYVVAFERRPDDAQILWDRAAGRLRRAAAGTRPGR